MGEQIASWVIFVWVIAAIISFWLLYTLFKRLKEISDFSRQTRNECETIRKSMISLLDMYAEQNGFQVDYNNENNE